MVTCRKRKTIVKNFSQILLIAVFSFSQISEAANYIYPLVKKTVGPYDNYQGVYSADDENLYFTKTVKQVPNINVQENKGFPKPLFDDRSDSKDPATHPSKDILAFTYFKFDASGDVCILKNSDELTCQKRPSSIEKKPFWIGADHIGFLKRGSFRSEIGL